MWTANAGTSGGCIACTISMSAVNPLITDGKQFLMPEMAKYCSEIPDDRKEEKYLCSQFANKYSDSMFAMMTEIFEAECKICKRKTLFHNCAGVYGGETREKAPGVY